MNENEIVYKIAFLFFIFIGYSMLLFDIGRISGDTQATNYCKENLIQIVCPKTNDYLVYKHKNFEEVLELVKTKE